MKFLVTGGAGFIGSHFVDLVLEHYPDVRVVTLDALTYAGRREHLARWEDDPRHTFIQGDITDASLVERVMEEHRPDIVVNFAAETHVDRSIHGAPPNFLRTNALGVQMLLEAARKFAPQLFLQVSTDEVYGMLSAGDEPWAEGAPIAPRSPYAASKAAGDMIALSYFHTYGLPVVVSRAENNYGPRQFPEKVVPFWALHAIAGRALPVYGRGEQMRSWVHVRDHCRALIYIIEHGTPGQVYHVSAQTEMRNIELARLLNRLAGRPEDAITFVDDRPGHDFRYALATKKLEGLGFTPEFSVGRFAEGLKQTLDWYKAELPAIRAMLKNAGEVNSHIASSRTLLEALDTKKLLIFGRGQLGGAYQQYFTAKGGWDVEVANDVDIRDAKAVQIAIAQANPHVVINAVGKTNIDWCEQNKEKAFSVNTLGTQNIAVACEAAGVYFVHISSGCVMESKTAEEVHSEEDIPSPLCFYSWTKVWADEIIMDRVRRGNLKALVIRPRQLLSALVSPRNALTKMLTYTKFIDTANSCTVVEDLLWVTDQLMEQNAMGVFNVVNPGITTPLRIANVLKKTIKPDMQFERISKEELDRMTLATRVDAVLSTAKLASYGITLPEIEPRLYEICMSLKENLAKEGSSAVMARVQQDTVEKLSLVNK